MRKLIIIAAALILSQLTGCVAHRYHGSAARNYNSNDAYSNQYAYQSQGQYQEVYRDQYAYQAPQVTTQYQDNYNSSYQNNSDIAQIVAIRNIGQVRETGGGGAVVGAILGGIIGNQLARGDDHNSRSSRYDRRGNSRYYGGSHSSNEGGRAAATVGGAIIGGLIGNEVDRSSSEQISRTEITLRLANGRTQAVLMDNPGQFRVGDRVRVANQNGRLEIM
jgi:outer membrane lipoprotein SlyB